MQRIRFCSLLLAGLMIQLTTGAQAQSPGPANAQPAVAEEYPASQAGILIHSATWQNLGNEVPAKTKVAHGIAASMSYGLVPGKVVADYAGEHAATQVPAGRVTICICHILSLPGNPVIVRLQSKKSVRELDGGKVIVYPLVGGSKMADANKSDWVPTIQEHPDPQVWLIHTQTQLPAGEYALMLGTQNLSIFPFTVVPASSAEAAP